MKQELINTIQTKINSINNELNPGYSILEKCNFIVTDSTCFYTVGISDNQTAIIETGKLFPVQFTEDVVREIASGFNAYNGNGKIDLIAMYKRDFLRIKLTELETLIETLNTIN